MRNFADVTGGKLIAVLSQFISGLSAINPLVTFYDIHGRKRVAIFYFVPIFVKNDGHILIKFFEKSSMSQ
jgi:hypothetical protein